MWKRLSEEPSLRLSETRNVTSMIPIQDENPAGTRPYVNWILIVINIVVFLYSILLVPFETFLCTYGFKPAEIAGIAAAPGPCEQIGVFQNAGLLTFLTSMFLHGGLFHIGGNMLYLWIFGDNIEDRTGHIGYIAFYLASGVAASLAHMASDPSSLVPAVGASGAISGVLGAYIVRFPRARVRAIVFIGRFGQLIRLPAYLLIGFWFFYQLLLSAIDPTGGVAYFAHIGGFIAGLLFAFAIPKKKPTEY